MEEILDFVKNRKNLVSLLTFAILLLALPLTVKLVGTQVNIKSRAVSDNEVIDFTGPNVKVKDGKEVAIKPQIALQLTSPFGPPGQRVSAKKVGGFLKFEIVSKVFGQEDESEAPVYESPPSLDETTETMTEEAPLEDQTTEDQTSEVTTEVLVGEEEIPPEQPQPEQGQVPENTNAQTGIPNLSGPQYQNNEFGHYSYIPTQRPYFWLSEENMTPDELEDLENWKMSPYVVVWIYDIEPGPENNWAGWGPPPPGWTTRSQIPKVLDENGFATYFGNGLPWPLAGPPDQAWVHPGSASQVQAGTGQKNIGQTTNVQRNVQQNNVQRTSGQQGNTQQGGGGQQNTSGQGSPQQNKVSQPSSAPSYSQFLPQDFCKNYPSSTVCPGGQGGPTSCSGFYAECQDANGNAGTQWCSRGVLQGNQCVYDSQVTQSCDKCNVRIIGVKPAQNVKKVSPTPTPLSPTPTASSKEEAATTVGYKIAESPSELADAPTFKYKEPLVLNYTFKDKTPEKEKFIFVEFIDSKGKTGGCGPNGTESCSASIELSSPEVQNVNCPPDPRIADIYPKGGDKLVNTLDASELMREMSIECQNSKVFRPGDLNKDYCVNAVDLSCLTGRFGKI